MPSDQPAIHVLRPKSLADEATEVLRRAIVRGELEPGQRLSESALATQMGVSRNPVREALARLEFEGLVTSSPNRGSLVRYLRVEDLGEIFDFRAILEGLACQILVHESRLLPDDFACLERYIDDFQQAVHDGDYTAWVESEIAFHEFILRKAGSKRLLQAWQNLHVQCVYASRQDWEEWLTAYGSHPHILKALREGKPEDMIPLHQRIYGQIKRKAVELLRRREAAHAE